MENFIQNYRIFPLISIGVEFRGQSCVLIDNEEGMHEAISHLIIHHNFRHIAFIQGPSGHPEAELRFTAYKKTLEENDILFDPNLIAPGDFREISGTKAMHLLIDERNVEFDAVVAANDIMAIGAAFELQNRGYSIPQDVAIIGFDDIPQCETFNPPLTTIRQPLYQLGEQAGELLLMKLEDQNIPPITTCLTKMVIRRSCGCFSKTVLNAAMPENKSLYSDIYSSSQLRAELIKFFQATGITEDSFVKELVTIFELVYQKDLKEQEYLRILSKLDRLFRNYSISGKQNFLWQDLISGVRNFTFLY